MLVSRVVRERVETVAVLGNTRRMTRLRCGYCHAFGVAVQGGAVPRIEAVRSGRGERAAETLRRRTKRNRNGTTGEGVREKVRGGVGERKAGRFQEEKTGGGGS